VPKCRGRLASRPDGRGVDASRSRRMHGGGFSHRGMYGYRHRPSLIEEQRSTLAACCRSPPLGASPPAAGFVRSFFETTTGLGLPALLALVAGQRAKLAVTPLIRTSGGGLASLTAMPKWFGRLGRWIVRLINEDDLDLWLLAGAAASFTVLGIIGVASQALLSSAVLALLAFMAMAQIRVPSRGRRYRGSPQDGSDFPTERRLPRRTVRPARRGA
jgi:hypothetical protein